MAAYIHYGDKNYDACPGGNITTTLDTHTINGARLTVDTDTRYCASHVGTASSCNGSLDTVTISSALGGDLLIDGTKAKLIPYKGGSGTTPALYLGLAITAATWSGSVVTITTATHNLTTGDWVHVGGLEPNAYNGLYQITVTAGTTFTYELAADPGVSTTTNAHMAKYFTVRQALAGSTAISGGSWSSSVTTVTANSHGLVTGDWVLIAGVTPAAYNGYWLVTGYTTNTFTFTQLVTPGAWSSGGTTVKTVQGYFLGCWSAFNVAPIPLGTAGAGTVPATGFIKVKGITGGNFTQAALTIQGGSSPAATAVGPQLTGWIEVVGAQAALCTVPRLGSFSATGDWFYPLVAPRSTTTPFITRSGTTATLTFTAHGVAVGSIIIVTNATHANYNGTFTVTSVAANSLTYTISADPGVDSTAGDFIVQVCTSGAANQQIQLPASLANTYYAGVWIETSVGSNAYEFYASAGSLVAANSIATNASVGKVCWISTQGLLRIGHDGTQANGYVPVSGLKIRVPNIITINSGRNTTLGSGSNTTPNTTLATRWEFATTGGGVISMDKVTSAWYMTFAQAFSLTLTNCAIMDNLTISELASAINLNNVHVAPSAATIFNPLLMSLCFAGGTFTDVSWTQATAQGNGNYAVSMTDIFGLTITNEIIRELVFRAHATSGVATLTRVNDSTWTNRDVIGGRTLMTTCSGLTFTTCSYADRVDNTGTTNTFTHYAFDLTTNCSNITVDGLDFFGLANRNPYLGLMIVQLGTNAVKLRNVGTAGSPLNLETTNGSAYVIASAAGAGCTDIEVERVYTTNPRTGMQNFDNSISGVVYENVWAGSSALTTGLPIASLNTEARGLINGYYPQTNVGQTSVYGTHFMDYFDYSTAYSAITAGEIIVACNEKTSESPSSSAYTEDSLSSRSGFNSVGVLQIPVANDQVTWTWPTKVRGHTAFRAELPAIVAPATGVGNLTVTAGSWSGGTTSLTCGTHKLAVGDTIVVTGVTPVLYNGTFVVTGITSSTIITYKQPTTPGTWSSGGAVQVPYLAVTASSESGGFTTLTIGTHGLTAGDTITLINALQKEFNGTFVITNIVSATQVRYAQTDPGTWTSEGTIRMVDNINLYYQLENSGTYRNLRRVKTGCTMASASDAVIAMADTSGLEVGDYIFGNGVGIGSIIQSINPNVSVTGSVNNLTTSAASGPRVCYFNHLPAETVASASTGFDLKVRATTIANGNTSGLVYIDIPTVATSTSIGYQYPLDLYDIVLQNIVVGSAYEIYNITTATQITTGTASDSPTTVSISATVNDLLRIRVRKASSGTKYVPFETNATVTSTGATVYVSQIVDSIIT